MARPKTTSKLPSSRQDAHTPVTDPGTSGTPFALGSIALAKYNLVRFADLPPDEAPQYDKLPDVHSRGWRKVRLGRTTPGVYERMQTIVHAVDGFQAAGDNAAGRACIEHALAELSALEQSGSLEEVARHFELAFSEYSEAYAKQFRGLISLYKTRYSEGVRARSATQEEPLPKPTTKTTKAAKLAGAAVTKPAKSRAGYVAPTRAGKDVIKTYVLPADKAKFKAAAELHGVSEEEFLRDVVLAVIANYQDPAHVRVSVTATVDRYATAVNKAALRLVAASLK